MGLPRRCPHPGAERRSRTNARTNPVDSGDQDVVPAVFHGVVGAPVAVDTPVAREGGGDAGGAGGEGVAVEEGEVGVGQVGAQLFHSDGQFAGEMGLSALYAWEQVIPDKNYKSKKRMCQEVAGGGYERN